MSQHFAIEVPDAPAVEFHIDGKKRKFDLDHSDLPDWVDDNAFTSGGFPYEKKLKNDEYEKQLHGLQKELVKVLFWLQETGERILIIFEGRDAAGKGGTIARFREFLNPRYARSVALAKPSDVERGQWYFQRYAHHFPTSGEFVFFDRSWYNRAGVEPVMGFCTPEQHNELLREVPLFEHLLVNSGIRYFKFWLNIGREMQLKRFHERRHDPLKIWKLSPIDIKSLEKWDDYTRMRDLMFRRTDSEHAPWTVIRANDKRRARINSIRAVLKTLDYTGKDPDRIGEVDDQIVRPAIDFND